MFNYGDVPKHKEDKKSNNLKPFLPDIQFLLLTTYRPQPTSQA